MTPEEKKSELQRHRDITLATIDYLLSIHAGSFVLDGEDTIADYYKKQKLQIEKYFKQRRLDKLQQRLSTLIKQRQSCVDLNFSPYIKEKTGYHIDLFSVLEERVGIILLQNEIRSDKEEKDVATRLQYLLQTAPNKDEVEKLNSLLSAYSETLKKRKGGYTEKISTRILDDGIEEEVVSFSTGPRPKHFKETRAISPDGVTNIYVIEWSDGKQAVTSVTIQTKGGSGAVYAARGICSHIQALWKDNTTVVIKTHRNDEVMGVQHKEVRSFNDHIRIEYIDE